MECEKPIELNTISKQFSSSNKIAVKVKDLRYSYLDIFGNPIKHALNELTLNVPKGKIYALLGPNGAGKTTLIKCLVNRLQPSSGVISIFGRTPGSPNSQIPGIGVGYVPQELSLFLEFTIEESLIYFGKLYGLTHKEIAIRTDFLLEFLRLPEKTRSLSALSDGQRRRISMSIGLIHSPPLLILDEPTVGVDPLLRQSIWKHLEHLSQNCNITIIITTHYIEEAGGASIISFMRDGHILTEESPQYLLKKHNTTSLEEVFLQICYNVDSNGHKITDKNTNCVNNSDKQLINSFDIKSFEQMDGNSPKDTNNFFNYNKNQKNIVCKQNSDSDVDSDVIQSKNYYLFFKYWALFFKSWIKLRGNLTLVFWVLLLPSVEISLFLMVTGPPHGLLVSVFNDEPQKNFSSQVLDMLDTYTITQIPYDSLQLAIESVESGHTTAVVSFSSNFTDALLDRLENKFLDESSNNSFGDNSGTVGVYADMSNIMMGPQIVEKVRSAVIQFLQNHFRSIGENPRVAEIPLISEYIYGKFDPTFAEYALPGLMSFIMFYAPLKLCTFSMLKEREEGILERSLVAGVNVADYLISHIVLQFISLLIQIMVYCFTIFFIWNLQIRGSVLLFIIEIIFHGFCSISFGVLISSLVSSESAAMVIRVGVLLPSFFFSGIIWPTESYNPFLQTLTLLSPLTLPTEAFRSIMHRGWGLQYFPVWIAIISNCIHSIIYLLIAVFAAKVKILS